VAILNPQHLLEQAERLVEPPPAGPPRQVDIRRAISSAYYAVFHAALAAAADEFIGATVRSDARYGLVYRSVDHKALAEVCTEIGRPRPSPRYVRYSPEQGFGEDIQVFASIVLDLQGKRHAADYDPMIRVTTADAKLAVGIARAALERLGNAAVAKRKTFLALLLFRPR
jgi:hypothetical protein